MSSNGKSLKKGGAAARPKHREVNLRRPPADVCAAAYAALPASQQHGLSGSSLRLLVRPLSVPVWSVTWPVKGGTGTGTGTYTAAPQAGCVHFRLMMLPISAPIQPLVQPNRSGHGHQGHAALGAVAGLWFAHLRMHRASVLGSAHRNGFRRSWRSGRLMQMIHFCFLFRFIGGLISRRGHDHANLRCVVTPPQIERTSRSQLDRDRQYSLCASAHLHPAIYVVKSTGGLTSDDGMRHLISATFTTSFTTRQETIA